MTIKASSDRKTQAYPAQRNTFGMMPGVPEDGGTCPGATSGPGGCRFVEEGRTRAICYVDKLIAIYKNVKGVLEHNTELLDQANYEQKVGLFLEEFLRFYKNEKRRGNTDWWYRIHWSGDVPDEEYAKALREAMERTPFINYWGYTRSFFTLPIMAGLPNCQWYISTDENTLPEAYRLYEEYQREYANIHLSYMGHTKPPELKREMAECPVDKGKMPLAGACYKCRLCFAGAPIFFKIH